MLGRWPLLLILGFSLLAAQTSVAQASHPFQGSGQAGDINYLYRNLEVPVGIGKISYSLCGSPYGVPSQWGTGVENWDSAIGRWQFDPVACGTAASTQLRWETGEECGAGAWACWYWGGSTPGHGTLKWRPAGDECVFDGRVPFWGDIGWDITGRAGRRCSHQGPQRRNNRE